ncbi:MAG: hypothetical protein R3F07_15110 [Opitutaceae bacterium]
MKTVTTLLIGILAAGCTSTSDKSAPARLQAGLSADTPVVLSSGLIKDGVAAEDAWLRENCPGFQRCSGGISSSATGEEDDETVHFTHRTDSVDGRILSVVCVVLPGGEEHEFYFDVTAIWNAQGKQTEQSAQKARASTPR